MRRVPLSDLTATIHAALLNLGLTPADAALSARLTAETDLDGIHTHGIARLPRFAEMVRKNAIDPTAVPTVTAQFGAIERWDGHRGPGNLAAYAAMARACALARQHGLGAVALGNTAHWQRGGTYGWQAAGLGLAAICWTNTLANLPPWGATTPALGNNPLVIAIPQAPAHIVLDMAMSQYSYGTLAAYGSRNQLLPLPGGFDQSGNLTTDPAAIEQSQRALPIGYWKGSGLSFVLDVLAAMLSGGLATHQIPLDPLQEVGLSQVFLAIDPSSLESLDELRRVASGAIESLHAAAPASPGQPARYPGEATLRTREQNLQLGIPVDEAQFQALLLLAK